MMRFWNSLSSSGGDEVGRRGEEEAVGALGGRLDPGADLVERAGGAVGLDHLVADRGRDGGEVAAAEGVAGGDRVVGEAVQLPERHVGLHRRVEGDRAAGHLDRPPLVVVDRAADGRQVVEVRALAAGALQAGLEGVDDHLVDPAQALDRVADQPVGDVAGHPRHPRLDGGGVDRRPPRAAPGAAGPSP